MGLDSYIGRRNGDGKFSRATDLNFPEIHLCGGLMSGGNDSFRGKVYDSFIYSISGETLYVESELDIHKVAQALREFVDSHSDSKPDDIVEDGWGVTYKDAVDLLKLFEFADLNNLDYYGWW